MDYLSHFHTNADVPVHFYLITVEDVPDRIFFSYQDLIRNVNPDKENLIYCFDGRGKKMAYFHVFRGLNNELVIANDRQTTENGHGIFEQQRKDG